MFVFEIPLKRSGSIIIARCLSISTPDSYHFSTYRDIFSFEPIREYRFLILAHIQLQNRHNVCHWKRVCDSKFQFSVTEFIDLYFRSRNFVVLSGKANKVQCWRRGGVNWFTGRFPIFYFNHPMGPRNLDVDYPTESCALLISYSLPLLSPNPKTHSVEEWSIHVV